MKKEGRIYPASYQKQKAKISSLFSGGKKERLLPGILKGFSLLETLITLSILLLLVLIGASFSLDNKKHQLETAVGKINSGLSLARFKAVHHQRPVKLVLRKDGYDLLEYEESSSTWVKQSSTLLEGVQIEANNSPVFYPQGTVSGLATIKVRNERGLYSISIAITGRTKVIRLE
jgi:prepilin-type N-terminal cleavage/methylation domain-containing protein